MTLPDGYIGQRVRTRGGSAGTIKVVSTRAHMPFYGVQFDEPRLEYLHFTQLVPASEESMTKTIEERVEALEKLITEDKIGSWRRATEAVGGRLTGHDAALNEMRSQVAAIEERHGKAVERLEALRDSYIAGERYREKLRNGPKSYDKRLAALEESVANLIGALSDRSGKPTTLCAWDSALANIRNHEHQIGALERRDDDPLRHVHWSAVPYGGTGDDATDDDCDCFMHGGETRGDVCTPDDDPTEPTFDDLDTYIVGEMRRGRIKREAEFISPPDGPASRDIDSLVDQTAIAVRDFIVAQYQSLIEAGVSPYEARNRVALHRQEIVGRFVGIASEKY